MIEGVDKDSKTETYFAFVTHLNHPRWKDIQIIMSAGKKLGEARKEIILTLKHPVNCYLCEIGKHGPNKIIFRLEPNDEIIINFWTKKPGLEQVLEKRSFSFFLYEKENKASYVEEYAKVIYNAINGDQSLFITNGEVEAEWKFSDPIIRAWKENIIPLAEYNSGIIPVTEFTQAILDKSKEEFTYV
jgi:glucose-6-phosphate 1-dehydrogenase